MNANIILSVQKDVNTVLIPLIDENDYFHLKYPHSSRTQLFDFAIALGSSAPTPLANKADHTRGNYVQSSEFMYRALLFHNSGESKLNEESAVCNMAEQYANTGFCILKEYMGKYEQDQLLKKLLLEMDKEFDTIESEIHQILEI